MIEFTCDGDVTLAGAAGLHAFVLTVHSDHAGHPPREPCVINLPVRLANVLQVDRLAWDAFLDDVRCRFPEDVSQEQITALQAVAYIYSWFADQVLAANVSERAGDLGGLWDELVELARTAIVMGMMIPTPGENLLINLQLWAKRAIPDAFPANFDVYDEDAEP